MPRSLLTMPNVIRASLAGDSAEIASRAHFNAMPYYFALAAMVVGRFWALPLRDGFWLDETGTVWAIQGPLRDVIARCDIWPSQSPAYSLIAWFFFRLPGSPEVLLRLPSIIAMGAAAYLLYRLAVRLAGPQAAWPSVIVFASIEPVAFAATDARPYAIAMLSVMGAMLFLVRWLDTGRALDGLGYCLLASLSVYMHFVFGVTLLLHLAYAIFRVRTEKRVAVGQLCLAASLVGLLLLPAAFHLRAVLKTGHSFSFAGTPTANDLLTMLAPPVFVGSVLVVLLLAHLAKQSVEFRLPQPSRSSLVLVASWVLVPVGLLAGISATTSLKLFLPRYTLPSEAGLALIAGWLLSGIKPARTRLIAIAALVLSVFAIAPNARFAHGGDWRAALAAVRSITDDSSVPVLIRSGFVESEPFNWLGDQTRSSYLFAPLMVYPAPNARVVRLPWQLNPDSAAYLNALALDHSNGFVFVNMGDLSYNYWLQGRLSPDGFVRHRVGQFGGSLTVDTYFRSTPQELNH